MLRAITGKSDNGGVWDNSSLGSHFISPKVLSERLHFVHTVSQGNPTEK